MSTSGLTRYKKKEENIHRLFLQVFNNRRKMSLGHSDKFSKKGGKYPMVVLTKFHNKEENVPQSFEQFFKIIWMPGRKKSEWKILFLWEN